MCCGRASDCSPLLVAPMTDREQILAQFLAEHDPPASDPRFIAAAMVQLHRRQQWDRVALWSAASVALATVLVLVGPLIAAPLVAFAPVAAPIAIVGSVLFMTRRRYA